MPELPEVEYGRKIAESVAHNRVITAVACEQDPIVFCNARPTEFEKCLIGRTVLSVRRHGKYLWFELDRRPWPVFHFGMTGAFVVPGQKPLKLESSPKKVALQWPPRYAKIRLTFDDQEELAMTNKRRLGRIRLQHDPPREKPLCDLGFDPLLELPDERVFTKHLKKRRGRLKGILLDQSFAAGVGNWIADEVLYQAQLDPRRLASSLSSSEIGRLRETIGHVIHTAVAVDAKKDRFPPSWLFHKRWGKNPDQTTEDGHPIEHVTLGGRTTAWVPSKQK